MWCCGDLTAGLTCATAVFWRPEMNFFAVAFLVTVRILYRMRQILSTRHASWSNLWIVSPACFTVRGLPTLPVPQTCQQFNHIFMVLTNYINVKLKFNLLLPSKQAKHPSLMPMELVNPTFYFKRGTSYEHPHVVAESKTFPCSAWKTILFDSRQHALCLYFFFVYFLPSL